MDGDLISTGEDEVADLDSRHRKALAWTQGVRPHPLDSGGGIDKDGKPAAGSLVALDPEELLVNGEDLGVEDLLARAEVEATS